jgi:very-short-patch-repair endonuclease
MGMSSLGEGTRGVWTRAQALQVLSPGQVDGFVRRGTWQRVWRAVYADAGHVLDAEQRAFAAALATAGTHLPVVGPDGRRRLGAAACGRTAARVHGLPLVDDDDPATGRRQHVLDDVAVDHRTTRARCGGRTLTPYEVRLTRSELQELPSGLWLTAPARTLADCARLLSPEALVCAVDAALHTGSVDAAGLEHALELRHGRPGATALRQALLSSDARSESPAETLARLLLLPALPGLEPQVRVQDRYGRVLARFDLGDRYARFAVEADGRRGHAGEPMVAKDRRRDWATEQLGWHTERVTWYELRRMPEQIRRRVFQAYQRHLVRRAA